ncbi:MAG TPA: cytochrome-c peroxidase, partial [Chitinophagaceae bacterium]|nr:cytochrome-c peroxidase [Chitinophagaceae bacterium]
MSLLVFSVLLAISCSKSDPATIEPDPYAAIRATFGANIDPNNLENYSGQVRPAYIIRDNGGANPITNAKATLGRVLFYDKRLSINNTISCASCHKQAFAFSDTAKVSLGVEGGITARHSMRLINARFSAETRFFWDERAASLEQQTTRPIQDHAEMGFSAQGGRPGLDSLLRKLAAVDYYQELFRFVYGDVAVTEQRLQECLSQFVRSIQSFDTKFDAGRALVAND